MSFLSAHSHVVNGSVLPAVPNNKPKYNIILRACFNRVLWIIKIRKWNKIEKVPTRNLIAFYLSPKLWQILCFQIFQSLTSKVLLLPPTALTCNREQILSLLLSVARPKEFLLCLRSSSMRLCWSFSVTRWCWHLWFTLCCLGQCNIWVCGVRDSWGVCQALSVVWYPWAVNTCPHRYSSLFSFIGLPYFFLPYLVLSQLLLRLLLYVKLRYPFGVSFSVVWSHGWLHFITIRIL